MPSANERGGRAAQHRTLGAFVAFAGLFSLCAAQAGDVQRCEDASGRVTYSNEACPPGTKKSRIVDTSQPVAADAKGAAAETKAAGRIVRVQRAPTQAVTVDKDALCRELARRVSYARRDLETAEPQHRASAELAMRRAQEHYDLECKTE